MYKIRESSDNTLLASSCSNTRAACCKDGYIFLPKPEFQAIIQHLAERFIDLMEFISRLTDYSDFLLYNQKTYCQFLQKDESCELHPLGIKPMF